LKVTAVSTSVILKDILIGEVWLASGQSNMGFSIPKSTHAEEARKLIPHPTLRRFKVGPYIADEPLTDIGEEGAFQNPHWRRGDDGQWRIVDSERFGLDWISAVAAWFGHEIRISQGVPVGIIESHFGGSKLYCWMPRESLENSREFTRDIIAPYRDQKKKWDEAYAAWEDDPNRDPNRPPTEPWRLSCLYNAMIAPIAPLAMRGVIWYQGESNQGRAEAYRRQLPTMVKEWRKTFRQNDLAFLAVQLPAFGKVRIGREVHGLKCANPLPCWKSPYPIRQPLFRLIVVCPMKSTRPSKSRLGKTLALAARSKVFGEKNLVYREPRPKKITFQENGALIEFDQNLFTKDGKREVKGFSLAALDQKFHPTEGSIQWGRFALVTNEKVRNPVAVRYAWQDSPIANLQNKQGMPVGTFRSDIWELQTQARITTPLVLKKSGTPEKPEVFDGQGMLIDLGTRVSDHDWIMDGDLWTSQPGFLKSFGHTPRIAGQTAGLFIGEIPITIPRDHEAEKGRPDMKSKCYFPPEKLKPGEMGYTKDGSLYFRWPKGCKPGKAIGVDRGRFKPIILPAKNGVNGVSIACSNIIIRNLTVKYAGNDGFNIHGHRRGIRLEKVRALSCADEGISAHETTEMEVINSEIGWNGSISGGVTDVNDAVTTYRSCIVHDNAGAAFSFTGKAHRVYDSLIYNQEKAFHVHKEVDFKEERNKIK
jgi:sialate O-acetylesterase